MRLNDLLPGISKEISEKAVEVSYEKFSNMINVESHKYRRELNEYIKDWKSIDLYEDNELYFKTLEDGLIGDDEGPIDTEIMLGVTQQISNMFETYTNALMMAYKGFVFKDKAKYFVYDENGEKLFYVIKDDAVISNKKRDSILDSLFI